MFKKTLALGMAVLLCAYFTVPSAHAEETKVYKLRFASLYMDKHPTAVDTFMPWIQEVEKRSNGRIKIRYYNPGTVCPDNETYTSTVNGAVDIGLGNITRIPGLFPRHSVTELPFLTTSGEAASKLAWELHQNFPGMADEMKDVKVLWLWNSAPMTLHTTKKLLLNKVEDIKGQKINVWSQAGVQILQALGANPVFTAPSDAYLTLQRGMAQGVLNALSPIRSFKLDEPCKNSTQVPLYSAAMWCVMNKTVWESLPPDLQQIIDETTQEFMSLAAGKSLDASIDGERKILSDKGHTFIDLDDQALEPWRALMPPVYEQWVKEQEARGIQNARELMESALQLGAQYSAEVENKK